VIRRLLWLAGAWALLSQTASAASFHCDDALQPVQRLICGDNAVSALDYRLHALYSVAQLVAHPADPLRATQQDWLTRVRDKCTDKACLTAAYRERIEGLYRLLQDRAYPFEPEAGGDIRHAATQSPYCESSGAAGPDGGDWFSLNAAIEEGAVSGRIDGIFDCGRKVWGHIDIKGKLVGNMALVKFQAGWSEHQGQLAEAVIVQAADRMHWRVLSEITVESYIPVAEDLRLHGAMPEASRTDAGPRGAPPVKPLRVDFKRPGSAPEAK
jgi:uncharacterized protein